MRQFTFIDLFSGCGGFSLGFERAGFRCLAAIDSNTEAIATFRTNFPNSKSVFQRDLLRFAPSELAELIGTTSVDVVLGGPPCQGFSTARQRDGTNHGLARFVEDDRRHLYREFLKYVAYFKPRVFVMENVLGLKSAAGGQYFTRVQHEARKIGYRVLAQVADALSLGVPQKRKRQLIIGVRTDVPGFFPAELLPAPRALLGCYFSVQQSVICRGYPPAEVPRQQIMILSVAKGISLTGESLPGTICIASWRSTSSMGHSQAVSIS